MTALPDALDRERRIDIDRRLRPVLVRTQLIFAASILLAAATGTPYDMAVATACLVVAAGGMRLVERIRARSPQPERWLLVQQAVVTLPTAFFVATTGGVDSPAAPILAASAAIAAVRFAAAQTVVVSIALSLLVLATFVLPEPSILLERPEDVAVWLGALLGVSWVTAVVARSDREARDASSIDPLTGLLNRKALTTHFDEVTARARDTGEPVSLLVADIDDFKAVNDRHGHGAGDGALVAAAQAVRSALRSFDLAYRVGGDEFVVLLPGTSGTGADAIAQRIREAVADATVGGRPLGMSIGAATAFGAAVEWSSLFGAADRALYARKAARSLA